MFDLNARVGFHKHEVATLLVEQKLDGAQAAVADRAGQGAGGGVQLLAHSRIKTRRRSHFQQLLVTALQCAVALPDVGNLSAVANDLHLDMTGAANQPFDIQIATAKGGGGLRTAAGEGVVQLGKVVYRAHAAPAAASQGFQHYRGAVAERLHKVAGLLQRGRLVGALGQGHTLLLRQSARTGLVAKGVEHLRRGADKGDAGLLAGAGEVGVFAEETVTGVDRIAVLLLGDANQLGGVQIGGNALALQGDGLIGAAYVQRLGVIFGVHGNTGGVTVGDGAGQTNGDFATVGDENAVECHGLVDPVL